MGLENVGFQGTYASMLSDGTIRVKVEEGTEGAKYREYEASDGTVGSKWELVYNQVSGAIKSIAFEDTKYGETIKVLIDDIMLMLNSSSSFAEDLMKKLPNINFEKEVVVKPYSFKNEKGKNVRGLNIIQDDVKIENAFFNVKEKKTLHGFPELKDDDYKTFKKKDWQKYFLSVNEFLVNYTTENILPKLETIENVLGGTEVEESDPALPDFGS